MSNKQTMELEQGWNLIEKGIAKLHKILESVSKQQHPTEQFSSKEYYALHCTVYNIFCCKRIIPDNYWQDLYDRYKESFEKHLKSAVLPALLMHKEARPEIFLREVSRRWKDHQIMSMWLFHVFEYVDRNNHNLRGNGPGPGLTQPLLRDIARLCFHDVVYQDIKNHAQDAVIALIERERGGEEIDRCLLKDVVGMFLGIDPTLNCYEKDLEFAVLNDTSSYYSRKAASWIASDSCPDYMVKAEECLKAEMERVYLHCSSQGKVQEKVESELIFRYRSQLVEMEHSGFLALLRNEKVDHLSRMYRLFSRITQGLEPLAKIFQEHITAEGNASVREIEAQLHVANEAENMQAGKQKSDRAQGFVRRVIELYDKYMLQYVKECFMDHPLFDKAVEEAFQDFCNNRVAGSTSAELLAAFCDGIFKIGNDGNIEVTIENVVKILDFIKDKDLFAAVYIKRLARSLLADKDSNYGDEASQLVLRLKEKFGSPFTRKMELMAHDLKVVKERQASYEDYLKDKKLQHSSDLTVRVLTTGSWPTYDSFSPTNLPEEMATCVGAYTEFYGERVKKNARLTWICSMGCCHVTGRFEEKPIELVISPHQASTLLLFNQSQTITHSDVQSQLKLRDNEEMVASLLQSLSSAKYPILVRKTVAQMDYFEFNSKFSHRSTRIKIPPPYVDPRKKLLHNVDKDRVNAIDACIVRIMKTNKVLAHGKLVMQCVEELKKTKFKPDVKAIKDQIVSLMGRDFIARDKNEANTYIYLA